MRTLSRAGLIRVEIPEWPRVKAWLITLGYRWRRGETGEHAALWTPGGEKCVGELSQENHCYWLDACVAPDLEGMPPDEGVVRGSFSRCTPSRQSDGVE